MKCKRITGILLVVSMIMGILLMVVPNEKVEEPTQQAEETAAMEMVSEVPERQNLALPETDKSITAHGISAESDVEGFVSSPKTLTIAGAAETTADGTEQYRLYAEEGDTIHFGPSVLEQGEFAYQWQKWDAETEQYQDITLTENPTAKSAELTVAVSSGDLDREGVYRCVISCGSVNADAVFTITDDIPTCDTAAELIVLLRAQMVKRAKYYTAILTSGESVDTGDLYAHTGVPVEGDYLKNHGGSITTETEETERGTKYSFTMGYQTTAAQEAVMDAVFLYKMNEI